MPLIETNKKLGLRCPKCHKQDNISIIQYVEQIVKDGLIEQSSVIESEYECENCGEVWGI